MGKSDEERGVSPPKNPQFQLDLSKVANLSDQDSEESQSSNSPPGKSDGIAGVLIIRFVDICCKPTILNRFYQSSFKDSLEADHFSALLIRVCRYYGLIENLFDAVISESLVGLTHPQLMFRSDHCSTKLLRSITSQILSSSISNSFSKLIRRMNGRALTNPEVASLTNKILSKLFRFSFPSDFKVLCRLIARIISRHFPGQERLGLNSLFFLRYFCPLLIGSPESFKATDDAFYRENCLKVVKLIQTLANGTTGMISRDLGEKLEKLVFSEDNVRHMDQFFQLLTENKTKHPFSLLPLSVPSGADVTSFFSLVSAHHTSMLYALRQGSVEGFIAPKTEEKFMTLITPWDHLGKILLEKTPRTRDRAIFPHVPRFVEVAPVSQLPDHPPARSRKGSFFAKMMPSTDTFRVCKSLSHIGPSASKPALEFRKSNSLDYILDAEDEGSSLSHSPIRSRFGQSELTGDSSLLDRQAHLDDNSQSEFLVESLSFSSVSSDFSLLAVTLPSMDDFSPTPMFSSKAEIESWGPAEIASWLSANELDALQPALAAVDGSKLLSRDFTLPSSEIPAEVLPRFDHALNQLVRQSLNILDDSQFSSPTDQILALKEFIYKAQLSEKLNH